MQANTTKCTTRRCTIIRAGKGLLAGRTERHHDDVVDGMRIFGQRNVDMRFACYSNRLGFISDERHGQQQMECNRKFTFRKIIAILLNFLINILAFRLSVSYLCHELFILKTN